MPYYRFTCDTTLTPAEVSQRVQAITRKAPKYWESIKERFGKGKNLPKDFIGSVTADAFRLQQDIQHQNSAQEKLTAETAQANAIVPASDLVPAVVPELPASAEQMALELKLKAIAAREAEVLPSLDRLASPEAIENTYEFKQQELDREREVLQDISTRIMKLRTEMRIPTKITLLRKAEPPAR
jgi:hypothetical protein